MQRRNHTIHRVCSVDAKKKSHHTLSHSSMTLHDVSCSFTVQFVDRDESVSLFWCHIWSVFDQALLTHGSWAYFCYILYTKLDLYTQRNEHYGTRDILAVISGKNEMVSVYIFKIFSAVHWKYSLDQNQM